MRATLTNDLSSPRHLSIHMGSRCQGQPLSCEGIRVRYIPLREARFSLIGENFDLDRNVAVGLARIGVDPPLASPKPA